MTREAAPPLAATAFADPFPSLGEYITAAMSVRTALLSLYSGAKISQISAERGTATLQLGRASISLPIGTLVSPHPPAGSTISKADTTQIATELCRRVGWAVCLDFLRARRTQPVFSSLYARAVEETAGSTCWVLAQALQITSRPIQAATLAAYEAILDQTPTLHTVQRRLERCLAEPIELTLEETEELLRFSAGFELLPRMTPGRTFRKAVMVAGIVPIYFPLRDWCFVSIVATADPTVIWATVPDAYKTAMAQTETIRNARRVLLQG